MYSVVMVSVNAQTAVFMYVTNVQASRFFVWSLLGMSYIQTSRSGCKYMSSIFASLCLPRYTSTPCMSCQSFCMEPRRGHWRRQWRRLRWMHSISGVSGASSASTTASMTLWQTRRFAAALVASHSPTIWDDPLQKAQLVWACCPG